MRYILYRGKEKTLIVFPFLFLFAGLIFFYLPLGNFRGALVWLRLYPMNLMQLILPKGKVIFIS